ncbi:NUDIX domain-containing protein [Candidatus Dojkabacteria bacterium]|jgi:ADP-ribose pyrophosphatase YjhB (NUDIX family)|nr:NUDIX domain-containing protein [Candidatus Dojkabacteria bacterium]
MIPKNMEGSQFTFHLEQLIKEGLVSKEKSVYLLTTKGKELANRMDLGDETIKEQAKISVMMCGIRGGGKNTEYLLYTRRKSPFYGYQGFPTGKVKKGEDITDSARRELKEETNLEGKPELFAIRHYRIFSKDEELLEDKVYFIFRVINPAGELKSNSEGDFKWVNRNKVWEYLKKPVKEIEEVIKEINNRVPTFKERSYITEEF